MREKSNTKTARTPRLYIDASILKPDITFIELPKRAAHHLLTVLRTSDGSTVEFFNGDGKNYLGELEKNGKKLNAKIQAVATNPSESSLNSLLLQSISRGDRMDTSIKKCVELGINHIQPVYTTHSIPVLKGDRANNKQEHWQAIAISAAEQSGRSVVPEVLPAVNLQDWLQGPWL